MLDINKLGKLNISVPQVKIDPNKVAKKAVEAMNLSTDDVCTIGQHLNDVNRPSADIHTYRSKLLAKSVDYEEASKLPKNHSTTKNPTCIPILEDGPVFSLPEKSEALIAKFADELDQKMDFMTGDKGVHEVLTDTDINQTQYQKDLIGTLGSKARIQNQQDISKLNGRIPTVAELNDEFNKLAGDKSIPFEYIVDGCYARAHIMCETMMKDGINCAKMFTMIENPFGSGMLTAKNKFMNAEWWYHVAPLVFAKDPKTNKVEGFIMDPSMDKRPMKAEEWINKMWDKNIFIKIDIDRVPQYGPVESDGENHTFEESLQSARDTMKEYSKTLKDIKDQYYASHPDEKPPDRKRIT